MLDALSLVFSCLFAGSAAGMRAIGRICSWLPVGGFDLSAVARLVSMSRLTAITGLTVACSATVAR